MNRNLHCLSSVYMQRTRTANKANGIMAVIRRTFTRLDCKCFCLLFRSLVRPHLEYGVPVWFPYKVKDVYEVENVQKRATKQVRSLQHLNYMQRLTKLNMPTLKYRRHRSSNIGEAEDSEQWKELPEGRHLGQRADG